MLIESIRKQSETWWFRAFLFFLACLFIFQWGFYGMLTGTTQQTGNLVSVGGSKISVNQFAKELSRETARIKVNFKSDLSAEQQKQLYPYVLESMVNNLLIEREIERLNLRITDDQIKQSIVNDTNFKTSEGTFERARFESFLHNIQMTEKNFVDTLRKDMLRRQLVQTLVKGASAPQTLSTRLYSYNQQRRILQIVPIESNALTLAKEPTDAEIQDYFTKNPAKFTAPEYRDITALILDTALTLKTIKITEDQIKQHFETHEDEFKDRTFDQVKEEIRLQLEKKQANEDLFALTNKIDDALAGGANLEEIAKTYGATLKFFPSVSVEGVYDPLHKTPDLQESSVNNPLELRLIGEAFNEKEKETSKVIEDSEGTFFITRIDKIYPARPMTYEESRDKSKTFLIQDLKSEQAKQLAIELESSANQQGLFTLAAQQKGLKAVQIRVSRKGPLAPTSIYLPENFIDMLYHVRVGSAKVSSYLNDQNQQDFIVGYVEKVEPMELKPPEDKMKEFKDRLQQEIFNDLFIQYVTSLRKIFPVEYNNKVMESLNK